MRKRCKLTQRERERERLHHLENQAGVLVDMVNMMIMLPLGAYAYSQDDNLTSDTSNRRVQHGPNAKEQLSLTDREIAPSGKQGWCSCRHGTCDDHACVGWACLLSG